MKQKKKLKKLKKNKLKKLKRKKLIWKKNYQSLRKNK